MSRTWLWMSRPPMLTRNSPCMGNPQSKPSHFPNPLSRFQLGCYLLISTMQSFGRRTSMCVFSYFQFQLPSICHVVMLFTSSFPSGYMGCRLNCPYKRNGWYSLFFWVYFISSYAIYIRVDVNALMHTAATLSCVRDSVLHFTYKQSELWSQMTEY